MTRLKHSKVQARLAELLMLGRSYHFYPIIGLQRAEASHFSSGARDQFRAILLLGNISKQQKQMLVPEFEDKLTQNCGLGEGYLLLDGKGIEHIKVAQIGDIAELDNAIRQAMCS